MQKDLTGYLRLDEMCEKHVTTQEDGPVAEVKPLPAVAHDLRPIGLCTGDFVVSDDFDVPLPNDILDVFDGLLHFQKQNKKTMHTISHIPAA